MEKMDQTRTDCNLTRIGVPGETPRLVMYLAAAGKYLRLPLRPL